MNRGDVGADHLCLRELVRKVAGIVFSLVCNIKARITTYMAQIPVPVPTSRTRYAKVLLEMVGTVL